MMYNDFVTLNGADYIRAMFANTKNGKLILEDEEGIDEILSLDWDEETMERLVAKFEALVAMLDRLGKEHTRWEASTKDMPEDLLEIWNTYILPYPDHGMDNEELFNISMKAEFGEKLTKEEEQKLEKQQVWFYENALTRLPYNRKNPASLIQRVRRYEKMISIHAPKVVVDDECHSLAEEMVQYYCLAK